MKLSKKIKFLRHILEYISVLVFFYWPIRILPYFAVFIIAKFAGFLFYILIFPFTRLVKANIAVAFPEFKSSKVNSIAFRNISNTILTVLEFFWFAKRPDEIKKRIEYPEEERKIVEKYHKMNKGLIFVCPHLGNWELASLGFSAKSKIPFAVVVKPLRNPFLNKIVFGSRLSDNHRIISAKGSVKAMIKAIKDGCFIGTLIDQNTRVRDGGVFVDFFNLPVPSSQAPAMFAEKMNVPIVFGGCIRTGFGKYRMFSYELSKKLSEYEGKKEIAQE